MRVSDELMSIERGFWTGGADYFALHTDSECLVAFPEMARLMPNAELAATATDLLRWRGVELEFKGLVQPSDSFAVVSYEARAIRADGERYRSLVSSAYIRRKEGWKMVFHAQTPM